MKKDLQLKTIELRKLGYSVKELHAEIGVSKSTISRWIQNVSLSDKAKKRLESRSTNARIRSEATIREKTKQKNIMANEFALGLVNSAELNGDGQGVLCSMIYYCEGAKSLSGVNFANTDPALIKLFLSLLRKTFTIKEEKLRILMQLHDYHDEVRQKNYWSEITAIPPYQFHKSYQKTSNHKYKKEGYQGCITVRYYDSNIARRLSAIAKTFMERYK